MTLEDQVCSLELAKKLKELGVRQKSAFYWTEREIVFGGYGTRKVELERREGERVSAFTVAELGEMLPLHKLFQKRFEKGGSIYCAIEDETGNYIFEEDAPTEADARAKILIYVIENQLAGDTSFG